MKNYELRITNYELFFLKILCVFCLLCGANLLVKAQSTNQSFPTAVTSNELTGTIRARDLGDARLTTYFYAFNGKQGDIFINVVTKNLDGDIDIFTADNLKPLTKITVYSDNPDSETGRVIYLRQPQKLILRVEGKTPTDEPATFRIKFAGSFEAVAGTTADTDESKQPEVKASEEGDIRVNSVGTIIEVKPKPTPKPTTAKVEKKEPKKTDEQKEPEKTEDAETAKKDEPVEDAETKKPEVVVTDNLPEKKDDSETKRDETSAEKETPKKNPAPKKTVRPKKPAVTTKTESKPKTSDEKKTEEVDLSQLENIQLIVIFKDGTKIERPMSEILKFSVDKGILTIIAKDGSIGRYSILDITKITVE